MEEIKVNPLRKGIKNDNLPHFFCPGCGCGQALNYFLTAIDELGMDLSKFVGIGGVGCTARIPVYLNVDALHGVHGRTLAWATGIKLANPEIPVVIFAGDGDLASIGGNHLIHAARRNLDVCVILVNNLNFAMTGGQVAPTTPGRTVTMTTPYGSPEPPFDICEVAIAAGATHVSRQTTVRPIPAINAIKRALQHKGFSLVEIISQCPTQFGRYALRSGSPLRSIKWIEERSVTQSQAQKLTPEERKEKFVLGQFVDIKKPVYAGSSVYEREA
jgi:2-oxoglutarate ferredoxin oxidoreductase subunit beta